MWRKMPEYPTIPDPTPDLMGLQRTAVALRQAVELLTGQRGDTPVSYPIERIEDVAQLVDDLFARLIPQNFAFAPVTGAATSTVITSATAVVGGPEGSVWPVTCSGDGSPQVQINANGWGAFGVAVPGDTVQIRLTSAPAAATTRLADVRMPGRRVRFSVTT